MSYQIYDIARLQARDFFFYSRCWKESILSRETKSLIMCNSYPKSGTHLLYQILYSIPGYQKWEDIISVQALCGIMNSANHIRWKIGSVPDKSIIRSHLMHSPEILEILHEQGNFNKFFIYRDLRDVAVSHARWITKEPRIFLHKPYLEKKSFNEQLMSSIRGVPVGSPLGSNISQPDIGQDFARWKGWISDPDTMAIKFEDLVGERGGGSEQTRLALIEEILDRLKISLSSQQIHSRFASNIMNPEESHTFKKGGKGQRGGWKEIFTNDHKEAFKKVAGELLIDLGYEVTLDW